MADQAQDPVVSERRASTGRGTGTFTTLPIAAGSLVFKNDRPLITVLDSARLEYHCEWCLVSKEDENEVRLKACNGCKVSRYCEKVSS